MPMDGILVTGWTPMTLIIPDIGEATGSVKGKYPPDFGEMGLLFSFLESKEGIS